MSGAGSSGGGARLLFFRKRHPPAGAAPGTLVPAPHPSPILIRTLVYDADGADERTIDRPDDLRDMLDEARVGWVDVQGLGDEGALRRIGEIFALHPLALEDAVNVPQRPKSERFERHQLFITRMTRVGEGQALEVEQVSIFLGARHVLTLQERPGDIFDPVRRRIRGGTGLICRSGPDYLAYALIDAVIDGYFPVVEAIGDRLEELEEEILERPSPAGLRRLHEVRRDLLVLRRAVWPQREAVNQLIREESDLIGEPVRRYLRDCLDHAVQIADVIETYRELAASLMDLYLSSLGQRTNEVMKVLTVMASIFIPLTFLAGVYGMNFRYMPELAYRGAYFILLGVMVATAVGMVVYFRRRGWVGRGAEGGAG